METPLVGMVLGLALAYLMMRRQKEQSHDASKTLDNMQGEKDEWEGTFWEASERTPVDAVVLIDYIDANGLSTQRTVTVRQFDKDYLANTGADTKNYSLAQVAHQNTYCCSIRSQDAKNQCLAMTK